MSPISYLSSLISAPAMPTRMGDIGLLCTRLFFGFSMAFAHGINKVPPSEKWVQNVKELGFILPDLFAWSAGLSELLGGILIALGLCTRGASFFVLITMLVAAFIAHDGDPYRKMELGLCYGVVSLMLMSLGAGRYSIDRLISARLQL